MEQSIAKHYVKIIKVISSCITYEHVLSAKQMIYNFSNYWGTKGNKYKDHLNAYFYLKRNQILNGD